MNNKLNSSDHYFDFKHVWWKVENKSNYFVLRNYIIGDNEKIDLHGNIFKKDDYETSVTYTTQCSYEFVHHAEELCKRFDGPISIAIYSPGSEFLIALRLIYYLRQCGHSCVKNNITWHMVYNLNFSVNNFKPLNFPNEFLASNNISIKINCNLNYNEFFNDLTSIYTKNKNGTMNVRFQNHLPYPINILRNIARLSVNTKYVLASDIELYPSINLVKMFKTLLEKEKNNQISLIDKNKPHIYILPIFEVNKLVSVPETKPKLIELMNKGLAIFFHKWVCDVCQNFVDRDNWIKQVKNIDELNIFAKTKRNASFWEPLYIGTNNEPFYDENLNWDGKRDKMSQMVEICLMDYDLLILDNAFLCHAPGIKHINPIDQKKRLPYIRKNNLYYDKAIKKLKLKYQKKNNCLF